TRPSQSPLDTPAKQPEAIVASAVQPPTAVNPDSPKGEFRIDRIVMSGLDVLYEDRAVSPRFDAPLTGLDVDIRDVTTLALSEPREMRFTAIVNSGKVNLPVRSQGGFPGLLGVFAAGGQSTTPASQPTSEDRDLFSQVSAS